MRVCFIALEYFGWGKYGGIGRATRDLAYGLRASGVDVTVVVPLGKGQSRFQQVDGIDVFGYPLTWLPFLGGLFKKIDADVYHSQGFTPGTWLAWKSCPRKTHLLTCQNPRTDSDWSMVNQYYPLRRRIYNNLVEPGLISCVKELDYVYTQARFTAEKTKRIYDLNYTPGFLPKPVHVPDEIPDKIGSPVVLFLGRFDGEKDPEAFMGLSQEYSEVTFIAAGKSHDATYDAYIRSRYAGIENLTLVGFIDGPEKRCHLEKSWVLVNTSVSEGFPVSFLEAAAYGCSILSPHDPDGFTSRFGVHVHKDDLRIGLDQLLTDDYWRCQGEKGYNYVKKTHEIHRVIDLHLHEYDKWMK